MSKPEEPHNPNFVTNELCQARIATIEAKINGLKHAIYYSAGAVTFVLSVVVVILKVIG